MATGKDLSRYIDAEPTPHHRQHAKWLRDVVGIDIKGFGNQAMAFLAGVSLAHLTRVDFANSEEWEAYREEHGIAKRGRKPAAIEDEEETLHRPAKKASRRAPEPEDLDEDLEDEADEDADDFEDEDDIEDLEDESDEDDADDFEEPAPRRGAAKKTQAPARRAAPAKKTANAGTRGRNMTARAGTRSTSATKKAAPAKKAATTKRRSTASDDDILF